ncbi:MAG: ATP phosphoribosyltransferase [Trueperaceae bacterium]|nr:ATP phosphoribosyltransferase [Trueperaceae bacterium]
MDKLILALPKGRVLQDSVTLLTEAGLKLSLSEDDRALTHDSEDVRILVMRNADVPTYVELGVADAGIVGKDVLLESGKTIYEPVDLNISHCRMSLIRPIGATREMRRVASKFPNVTQDFLRKVGSSAEVIKLSGNVELACLTGLADAVVDIVQTGSTLKANRLEEVEVIFYSSARFVVNRAALKLKAARLRPLIATLRTLAKAS